MKQHRAFTEKQKKLLSGGAIVIFVLLSAALAWFAGRPMVRFAREPEAFRQWVAGRGVWGMAAYAGMVFLQVLVAIIPGEPLEIAGGYAFGAVWGTVLCLLGSVLGSVAVFAVVRKWGVPLVEVFFSREKLEKLSFLRTSPNAGQRCCGWCSPSPAHPRTFCATLRPHGPELVFLAADRLRGPHPLHRHVHRGRRCSGHAELPVRRCHLSRHAGHRRCRPADLPAGLPPPRRPPRLCRQ